MEKRFFSSKQRAALYLASGGKCAMCGKELARGWHADHVTPYVAGGETDVINGQALCPECNEKKGAKRMGNVERWPANVNLREWQKECYEMFLTRKDKDFLAEATPGAGKTMFALYAAHQSIFNREAERIVIVVPTRYLCEQWATAANRIGINLDPTWGNSNSSPEASDYHGIVVTYQTVASNPMLQRQFTSRKTFVIFDEIHHSGDDQTWGKALREAFERAVVRLSISGTPFRTDSSSPIPFVKYDETGKSRPDYRYSYGDALSDSVCRPVNFPTFGGEVSYYKYQQIWNSSFDEDLPKNEAADRLRAALMPDGDWMREVIKTADEQLERIRSNGHKDAGGLIIAMDQDHARAIRGTLEEEIGELAEVVISDEKDSKDIIARYEAGRSKWLISVKMVSEGVDIKRLRVGVFATNTKTEMFFRQAVGRFVRRIENLEDEDDQLAFFYIPSDPDLKAFAEKIKEERNHITSEEILNKRMMAQRQLDIFTYQPFEYISAIPKDDGSILDGERIAPEEIQKAKEILKILNINISPELALKFNQMFQGAAAATSHPQAQTNYPGVRLVDEKKQMRNLNKRLVSQIHFEFDVEYSEINNFANQRVGITSVKDATLEQLKKRAIVLEEYINARKRV